MTNKPLVSIIIPSLGREEKLAKLLASIQMNAGYENIEILVEHDQPIPNNIGAPKMVKKIVDKSNGELVMFLGNDCVMEKDCVKLAVERMEKEFPEMDGLIGLNDCYWHGEFATHWLASKKLLPMLGGDFFYTGYHHVGCDNELTERCRNEGKYVWAEEAKIFHNHPVITNYKNNDVDDVYLNAYSKVPEDHALLKARSEEFHFAIRGPFSEPRIKPVVDGFMNIEYRIPTNYTELKVLNVGIGAMTSLLAKQLPFFRFKRLTHLEVYEPYIDAAKKVIWDGPTDYVLGDLATFDKFEDYDLVLMFDVLEHLKKEDSIRVVEKIKSLGKKMVVFGPLEDELMNHRHNMDEIESQEHLSLWTAQDFIDLGFEVQVLENFHMDQGKVWSAIWAVYYKD